MEVRLQATKDLLKWKKKRKYENDGWMDCQDKQPFHLSRECLVSRYVSATRFQIGK